MITKLQVDKQNFSVRWQNPAYRVAISQLFKDRAQGLKESYRTKAAVGESIGGFKRILLPEGKMDVNLRAKLFDQPWNFERKPDWVELLPGRSSWHIFLNNPESIDCQRQSFETILGMIDIFDGVVSAAEIISAVSVDNTGLVCDNVLSAVADKAALDFQAEDHLDRLPTSVGPTIEVRSLGGRMRTLDKPRAAGLDAAAISMFNSGIKFENFDRKLIDQDVFNDLSERQKENGQKLCLVSIDPPDNSDEGQRISLEFQETDYYTVMSCLAKFRNDESPSGEILNDRSVIRRQIGSREPAENRAPNSFCLHYVLRFADQTFLAIRRSPKLAYDKSRVSVSGEEQITPSDLRRDTGYPPALNWAYRAILEEVYPRRNFDLHHPRAQEIINRVEYVRFISLFYEERHCNFSMLCLIQIKDTRKQYEKTYLSSEKGELTDHEGNRYWFHQSEIAIFLKIGRLKLRPFKVGQPDITACVGVVEGESKTDFALHSSSLFRLSKIAELYAGIDIPYPRS